MASVPLRAWAVIADRFRPFGVRGICHAARACHVTNAPNNDLPVRAILVPDAGVDGARRVASSPLSPVVRRSATDLLHNSMYTVVLCGDADDIGGLPSPCHGHRRQTMTNLVPHMPLTSEN